MATVQNVSIVIKGNTRVVNAAREIVQEDLSAQGKGKRIVSALRATTPDLTEVTADTIKDLRALLTDEILRAKPSWKSPGGDTDKAKATRKANQAKVRVTAQRIMTSILAAFRDAGITYPLPAKRIVTPKTTDTTDTTDTGSDSEDSSGRTRKADAEATVERAIVQCSDDASKIVAALRKVITASLTKDDYVTVIAACNRIMKVQDAE
jgi:hypothetical protein